jgi:hypothetical protein
MHRMESSWAPVSRDITPNSLKPGFSREIPGFRGSPGFGIGMSHVRRPSSRKTESGDPKDSAHARRIQRTWTGLDWTGLAWPGPDLTGLDWPVLCCAVLC